MFNQEYMDKHKIDVLVQFVLLKCEKPRKNEQNFFLTFAYGVSYVTITNPLCYNQPPCEGQL